AGARKTALSARHVRIRRFVLTIGSSTGAYPSVCVEVVKNDLQRGEAAKRGEHLPIRKVGVAAAGIRQDKYASAFEPLRLKAERDALARPPVEDGAEERDADEGDDLRLHAFDLSVQSAHA